MVSPERTINPDAGGDFRNLMVEWLDNLINSHKLDKTNKTEIAFDLQAIKQFIDLLNSSSPHQPRKTVTPETAIQYLSARKFDIPKAVALYEANNQTRQREGLYGFDSSVDPLRSELATGKFTVLVSLN